ncbi:hypothetical protein ACN38_g9304 [Penicillium nordicum]|uniref:Uncharacterized protein n=1 Tax=Penicillium nordicum TaxID=229535 RepID=A0A0M8NUT4_9EURO|nr:hypothetical protein ACN38_g9304 [Penicillium nordicum]
MYLSGMTIQLFDLFVLLVSLIPLVLTETLLLSFSSSSSSSSFFLPLTNGRPISLWVYPQGKIQGAYPCLLVRWEPVVSLTN